MSERLRKARHRLKKLSNKKSRTLPVGTMAVYGPTPSLATKLVVAIKHSEDVEPAPVVRWAAESGDIRDDADAIEAALAFFEEQGMKAVISADRILGCPHSEGMDEAFVCPEDHCAAWAGIDRWTGAVR